MVGSRLMFRGYGSGRSRRAMDAGLLGHDTLLVLDEAYLAPAMGELLRALVRFHGGPEFRVMTLSAVRSEGAAGLPTSGSVLPLKLKDFADEAVRRRLEARKTARFRRVAQPKDCIGAMCGAALAYPTGAIAVFVERVADSRTIGTRLARAHGGERVAVLTGTLRGSERSALVTGAVWRRFAPARDRTQSLPAVYLVMTSAGEVGVDLDANHAVMDLVTLDSMIQRMGRINRAGFGTFSTKTRGARQGRNPRTGESIAIAASKSPSFKAGKRGASPWARNWNDVPTGIVRQRPGASSTTSSKRPARRHISPCPARTYQISSTVR